MNYNFLRNIEKPSRTDVAATDDMTDSINPAQNTSRDQVIQISPVSLNREKSIF